jgi:hypothetical protein
VNSAEAFRKAERARRSRHPVSQDQRRHLKRLSLKAGVVMPRVYSSAQATDAITRLEKKTRPQRQPVLEGFEAVSAA